MRTRIFRFLAGQLAALFIGFLVVADHSKHPIWKLTMFDAVGAMFAVYALFGLDLIGQFVSELNGPPRPDEGDDQPPNGNNPSL